MKSERGVAMVDYLLATAISVAFTAIFLGAMAPLPAIVRHLLSWIAVGMTSPPVR